MRNLYIPAVFNAPVGGTLLEFGKQVYIGKTRIIGLPHAEESMMLSRFDTIPERDRQTDGRTDRITIGLSISRICIAVLRRDKN